MSAHKRETVTSGGIKLPRNRRYSTRFAAPGLKYSSARPWILALAISIAMWVGIGWLIWKLI
jgi:hypothetical protein